MRREHGFTYLGLLAVLAFMQGALAYSVMTGSAISRRDREEELLFVGAQFRQAIQAYANATPLGSHNAPRKLEYLVRDERHEPTRRHLRKVYIDPLTARADWNLHFDPVGGIIGVNSNAPGRPVKQANFDPGFEFFKDAESYQQWIFSPAGLAALSAPAVPHQKSPPPNR